MKILYGLLLVATLGISPVFASAWNFNLPAQAGQVLVVDTSVNNIPATYTTGSAVFTGLSKKAHLIVNNATSTMLLLNTTSTATNCASGSDNVFVPPNQGIAVDYITIGSKVCVRSYSGTISSGLVEFMVY